MTITDAIEELNFDGVPTKAHPDGSIYMEIHSGQGSVHHYTEDEFLGFCEYYFDERVLA